MSYRNYPSREGGRHHTDPTSSRFNTKSKYHQRGRGTNRPVPNRRPTAGDDLDGITVSIGRNLTTGGIDSQGSSIRGRIVSRSHAPQQIHPSRMNDRDHNQPRWWRISIPQAGAIGKERVMSTLKVNCLRQFQPYHYFIDRDTNTGVFFVNSQQDADMLKRANRKIEVQNLGTLNIMVSQTSSPVPLLDEDLRRHFRDYICNRRFNAQTFQLNLSNLVDDEELSALGIYPQLNKQAFVRDVVDIINKNLHMTRQLDLGSNNISNLYEFRNLQLNNLEQLSLASNQLRAFEELVHLKQLTHLTHLFLKDNPLTSSNNKRSVSRNDLISTIQQKLPQLKRVDDIDLPTKIGFGVDNAIIHLPKTAPHCVPQEMQTFLAKFIDEYYRLFDTRGRSELHACYHDSCMFSLCIAPTESSIVPTKSYKYGPLIYDSRNLKKIFDDNKRAILLRHGKTDVLDFLRIKFPLTKHDGKSFHVDVFSTANNRAIFTVNGLYREIDQGINGPVRSFQRTFTCSQTSSGVLIVADHIMIINATDSQVLNMTRPTPPASSSTEPSSSSSRTMESQNGPGLSIEMQTQMIQKFSQQSGMNIEYSKLCLAENDWNYEKAAQKFQECQKMNLIPPEAFTKP
ncbi:unnamed protein product [Rotaria sordida]|uniref:Nuclear RNA export factor 1 n=1 Tax=Rotaria sordida TaxID=392033 RepID=A0A813VNP1_9BILA|nr:unnamed protein product [Rotaria sordida]CAF0888443.1 unnamed protein product [Rotaria sordida]CAF3572164.1 unnamed protein product [Rotaria sordida]